MSDLQFCTNKRHLRVGDWVEVESPDKILASLDEQGCLERLPFMPEMLKYCGQRFRVLKSAHKTCDTINKTGLRQMENAVHLEGIRCDGSAHGGCQAGCLLFMKEAWLKPVAGPEPNRDVDVSSAETRPSNSDSNRRCDQERLMRATRVTAKEGSEIELYRCQATELFRATKRGADLGRLRINIDYFASVLRASMSLLSKKGDGRTSTLQAHPFPTCSR